MNAAGPGPTVAPDLTSWLLKLQELGKQQLNKAAVENPRLLSATVRDVLIDDLVRDFRSAIKAQTWLIAPIPKQTETDQKETLHMVAAACVDKFRADHRQKGDDGARDEALTSPEEGAKLTPLSEIHPQTMKWLWLGRIPLGKITVLAGDPSLGKSFLTLDMAARVTTGGRWPDGAPACDGNVILVSAEDDAADTIRPRLDALGADVSRVHILESIRDRSGERGFSLASDTARLEAAIAKIGNVRLVVIDPISAFLGNTDSHKNSDVRALLAPLAKMAATLGVAIVCVTHLSKSAADPLNRLSGSIAFGATARAAWLVSRDPERHERRLMLTLKNNLALEPDGLAFAIQVNEQGSPVVAWEQAPVTITAIEHLRELRDQAEKTRHEMPIEDACDLLHSMLQNGPQPVAKVREEAIHRGTSERTVARARKLLGIETHRDGFGKDGGWVLELPTKGSQTLESPSSLESGSLWRSASVPTGSSKAANSNVTQGDGPVAAFGNGPDDGDRF
jgi:archaellum biogenesis ATPase FlaH